MKKNHNFKAEDYPQVFRISSEIWDAMDLDDIMATAEDMKEVKIFKAPIPNFAIEVSVKFVDRMLNEIAKRQNSPPLQKSAEFSIYAEYQCPNFPEVDGQKFRVYRFEGKHIDPWFTTIKVMRDQKLISEEECDQIELVVHAIGTLLNQILIVLFATRNTVRDQKIEKDLLSGRTNGTNKHRKDFPVTTTLRIGQITETVRGENGGGWKVRPHLRRGHLRGQSYGPNRELHRQIFIAPVFVNADEGWIAERKAYNVSVSHGRVQKQTDDQHEAAL